MRKTKKLTILAMTLAVAVVLSFVESQIPPLIAIPGVKLGLANIAIIFILYKSGLRDAIIVSLARIAVIFLIFGGTLALIYSIAGATVSLALMYILKRFTPLSEIGVSVAGGVAHNLAQITVAVFVLDTTQLFFYLPVLLLSGTLAGVVIGIVSALLVKKIKLE